ncbi:MAG: hypothetical protein Q7S28_00230 [bacterium]|nr:hypothetical protein [bacterium]
MKNRIFWIMGLCVVAFGFTTLSAHAMTVVANETIGTQNAVTLTQTLGTLQATLAELRGKLAQGNVSKPEKISGTLNAIRSSLLQMNGTIAALDARAAHLASAETPTVATLPASNPVTGKGMSYDGIPAVGEASAATEQGSLASALGTASMLNIGKRIWLLALIILALTIPFLFRKKNEEEPSVIIRTVEAPTMEEFEAPAFSKVVIR